MLSLGNFSSYNHSYCNDRSLSLSLSLSQMTSYRRTFQWQDGTMAFVTGFHKEEDCFYIVGETMLQLTLTPGPCEERHHHYLCELDTNPEKHAFDRKAQALLPDNLILNRTIHPFTDHMMCPEGHLTHTLFACEAQTSCWAERDHVQVDLHGSPGHESCPAPVTPLPPYFSCHRSLQVVGYTVVCDHRQDCTDGSDEGFCVFPACQSGVEITCNNKQVSLVQLSHLLFICSCDGVGLLLDCCLSSWRFALFVFQVFQRFYFRRLEITVPVGWALNTNN